MKKITAIIICLVFCCGFLTSCDEPDAYELYTKMTEAMAGVKSLDMDMTATYDITIAHDDAEDTQFNMSMTGNLKQVMKDGKDFDMQMNMNLDVPALTMNYDTAFYYTGGMSYQDISGNKIKMSLSVDEAMKQADFSILDFPKSAVKDFKITNNSDGSKKIEFTLIGEELDSFAEQLTAMTKSMYSDYPALELPDTEMSFGDVICEFVIDKDNMLKSSKTIYDDKNTVIGMEITRKVEMSITVKSYNNVTINFPDDLDSYEDISGLIGSED